MSKFTHAHGVDMVATLKQSIIDGTNPGVYIHGVNCQGVAKSGIAGQLVKAFPEAFDVYYDMVLQNKEKGEPSFKLQGNITCAYALSPKHFLVHCFTQDRYGRAPNVVYANYTAIKMCMKKIAQFTPTMETLGVNHIHYPMIGAGLAKGDWETIHRIIEGEIPSTVNRTLYTLD